jgi:hypothetical protein
MDDGRQLDQGSPGAGKRPEGDSEGWSGGDLIQDSGCGWLVISCGGNRGRASASSAARLHETDKDGEM